MPDVVRSVMAQARLRDGAISVAALIAAGMDRRAVEYRLRTGWLRRLHRGVYLVGAVAGPRVREHAALLATGPHAVVSHGSAAAVWRLLPERAGAVDVTLAAGHRRRRPGIVVHQSPVEDDDIRLAGALRLTAPAPR